MTLWMQWLKALDALLEFFSSHIGLGDGLAIVALTVLVRTVLLPIGWSSAYRSCIRHKTIARLQPQLQHLKQKFGDQPKLYAEKLQALYRENGMALTDGRTLLGALVQWPVLLGLYQALRDGVRSTRFLWVENLSRPDVGFALLAGLATMLLMWMNPDLPEHMRLILLIVPGIVAVVVALKVASALALYWTVSNCYSAAQTAVLHRIVASRIRSGTLTI